MANTQKFYVHIKSGTKTPTDVLVFYSQGAKDIKIGNKTYNAKQISKEIQDVLYEWLENKAKGN